MVFVFRPIWLNAAAPGGARALRTFEDIGAFILGHVDAKRRLAPHWQVVRRDLIQARFGAMQVEVHEATREALAKEGWLE